MSAYSEGLSPRCPSCDSSRVERSFTAVNVLTGSARAGSADVCGSSGFG